MSTPPPGTDRTPTIRRAEPTDAEALADLHLDCWDDAYTGLVPQPILDERRARRPERVQRWREIIDASSADDFTLVVPDPHHPSRLLGFASAGPGRDNDLTGPLGDAVATELKALYVRAARWDTGLGHALLQAAVGDRAAYLWVLAGNDRAIGFYERHGFRLDGTEDEHDEGRHVRMVRAGL